MIELDPLAVPLDGIQLVEASAGTGKTHAITTLAVRCLLERPVTAPGLLIVTFTTAATAELRGRVRGRIQDALNAIDERLEASAAGADELLRYVEQRRANAAADRQALVNALGEIDDAAIFTIHGFCQRVLQEFAFESGVTFDAELIGDPGPLIMDAAQDYWSGALFAAPAEVVTRLQERKVGVDTIAMVARLHVTRPDLRVLLDPAPDGDAVEQGVRAILAEAGPAVCATLHVRKQAANVQSFDDLLLHLRGALRGTHGDDLAARIRERYPIALIDEFQDTDPVQYEIFQRVYRQGPGALFLIGDPKQSIYGFRGADIFAYLGAKRDAQATYTLLTNRRSSAPYVEAVNAIFADVRAPFVEEDIPFLPASAAPRTDDVLAGAARDTAPLRILFARRTAANRNKQNRLGTPSGGQPHWAFDATATAIVQLLNAETRIGARRVLPGDIAALCRSNKQLHALHAALRRRGVPAVVQGDASVFDTPEAAVLERVLRALAAPGDTGAVRAAIVSPLFGITADQLAEMRVDERRWEAWLERFHRWGDSWRMEGFAIALQRLLDEAAVAERVLRLPGGERTLTNVLHLGELLQGAAVEARRGPLALVEWLRAMRRDPDNRGGLASEAAQIRLESDDHALTLSTVHRSKGLEYDVVVCPFLASGSEPRNEQKDWPRFHDRAAGALTLDLNRPLRQDSLARARRDALAEELRLLYVALTRARQLGIVVWGAFGGYDSSALGYLLHQSADAAAGELMAATKARIAKLTDAEILDDLGRLAERARGRIAIESLPAASPDRYLAAAVAEADLRARATQRRVTQAWRVSSFTALAGSPGDDVRAEEGIDRDQMAATEEVESDGALHGFPRGRRPGTLVHSLFEAIDFTVRDRPALRATAARLVAAFGLEAQWVDPLCAAVDDVLDTPLTAGTPPLRLRDVPTSQRLVEMEFAFPVALTADGVPRSGISSAALAGVFERYAVDPAVRRYAANIRALRFGTLAGYLRGYIDCVFMHAGRWYVVDYKSNDRGEAPGAYAPTALAAEMARHDYVLQYHLYAVAVHRYLRQRLRGYDYERDFGGALYLFVRGMHPTRGATSGVVFDRPPAALIEALSDLLAAAPAEVAS